MSQLPSDQHAPTSTVDLNDPLSTLHKMSRTAGLGTTEYVAVNATAVVCVILGVLSALAVLGTVLLIIPVAAIIVGIVAWRQIHRSGGTETGRRIAILGMLIALACVGAVGGKELHYQRQVQREQGQIITLIERLGKDVNQANYDDAWECFGPRFHERVKKEDFVTFWTRLQSYPNYGQIKGMRWNGILDVDIDRDSGLPWGRGFVIVDLVKGGEDRRESIFRKNENGTWAIEDFQGICPSQQQQPGQKPQ